MHGGCREKGEAGTQGLVCLLAPNHILLPSPLSSQRTLQKSLDSSSCWPEFSTDEDAANRSSEFPPVIL